MKNLIVVCAIPFIAFIICVLLVCLACISPIILIGYIWSTSKRNARRESEFYPSEKNDLKERVKAFIKAREVRM
jgi:hypothetical protein